MSFLKTQVSFSSNFGTIETYLSDSEITYYEKKWILITLAIYIEEKGWVKSKILLVICQYIEKIRLVRIIYKYIKFGF